MKIKKSLKLWERGIRLMPRGTQTMSKAPDQYVFGVHPIYLEKGKGCKVKDIDGNWYIDYPCALGPIILGHNHRRTVKAVTKQLKKGITFSLMSPLEVELAELLCEVIPCAEQVRYAKNGTDANLAAARVARSYTGKEVILKPEGHYHGWGDWHAASTTRDYGVPKSLKPLVRTFKYNDLQSLEKQLEKDDIAAIYMEPVALEEPEPGFLEGVRDLATKNNVVLVFDEIVTGFRWSLGGAQKYYGVTPDIACFGKAVANGMPLAIIAGKKEYMKEFDHIFFSMTFGGEACSLAAAVETVKEMKEREEEIFSHIWEQGTLLRESFNQKCRAIGLNAELIGCAPRHNVLFQTSDPSGCKDLFHQEMVKRGVLMGTQIYMTPAHTKKDVAYTIKAMKESLDVVNEALNKGTIDSYLDGERSMAIFKKAVAEGPND